MKKILFTLMFALPIVFNSCSDDEKEDNLIDDNPKNRTHIEVESSQLEILAGNKKQILATSILDISYISENVFYASVDQSGMVTANKVGKTDIILSNGINKETVNILINPKYTTYPDPFLNDFKATKSDIIKEVGTPDETDEDGNLIYHNYSSKASTAMYMFEGSELTGFATSVSSSHAEELGNFIRERYEYFFEDKDEYILYYVNASTTSEATIIVGIQINLSRLNIVYLPASLLSKSLSFKQITKDLLFKLNEIE